MTSPPKVAVDTLSAHRAFFAHFVAAMAGIPALEGGIAGAFASTPRERFLGPGPWRVFTPLGYITTPSDDITLLYQDITVALDEARQINNGQPILHAFCLGALGPRPGETVIHVGAGTGYYTAVLADLVGPQGSVVAYEVDADFAARAIASLADLPQVSVHHRSGAEAPLPACDVIYVNAGATAPLAVWLDALRPSGRLLFPLTPEEIAGRPAPGGMLLVTKLSAERYDARFIGPVAFISCAGARDEATAKKLTEGFARGDWRRVKSLRRDGTPDESCWVAGDGWWLSMAPAVPEPPGSALPS